MAVKVKYSKEITEALDVWVAADTKPWMTYEETVEVRLRILEVIAYSRLSTQLEEGLKKGISIKAQIEQIKSIFKQ